MSPSAASSMWAATFFALASTLSSALTTAESPTAPGREPQLAIPRCVALTLAEALEIGKLQRFTKRARIIADVVIHDHRRLMREAADEILAAQLDRIKRHFARADFDEPLDHESRLRTAGAAI